jgi:hypothetical protein
MLVVQQQIHQNSNFELNLSSIKKPLPIATQANCKKQNTHKNTPTFSTLNSHTQELVVI